MFSKTNEFIARAHKMAIEHVFHDEEKSNEHWLMLVVSEVGEMVEADRKSHHADLVGFDNEVSCGIPFSVCFKRYIKDTVEDEMADIAIRLYDFAGLSGVEFSDKELSADMQSLFDDEWLDSSFTERAFFLVQLLSGIFDNLDASRFIGQALTFLESWAKAERIDLLWHIERKMEYNSGREKRHGKAY